ncbi:translation elongation factor Ts [Roseiconus nitratireducens]|uniref:Elongation factor Ts n=1 Tax=Roseiconus nitratireducens TaxID=2605748 RepID=A0A5M6D1L6_9BACT|nr:translation elongation factor Ts [Roseiconus nitratireducens]KAA5541374.1 translation elongation factor Ts [Roseiconus nitratireducens]
MADITASAVKAFRERTGLPLMDCKKALTEAGGDEEKAVKLLRERGEQLADKRSDRETAFGRFGLYIGTDKKTGAMVELLCESAPVTTNEDFVKLADELATQLATGPGADSAEELLKQPAPSNPDITLGEMKSDLFNRIREVFNVGRMVRVDSTCGGYMHHAGTTAGVLVEIEGGNDAAAKDVAMHTAAMKPEALDADSLDPAVVEKEREILKAAALAEGKPEQIVEKMVEGRLRNFFAERCLLSQPFVKDDKQTVGEYAKANGMKVKNFWHWVIGEKAEG